jgi:hypothetical protein
MIERPIVSQLEAATQAKAGGFTASSTAAGKMRGERMRK